MKSKLLLLTLSFFLVSSLMFGQGLNRKSNNSLNNQLSANGKNLLNGNNNELIGMSGFSLTDQSTEVLQLNLKCDANPNTDNTIVIFNFSDPEQGAQKEMFADSTAPEIWSVKNGQNYWISFLGDLDSSRIVPITVKAGKEGNYTLSYNEIASFGANIEIKLEDRVTGTMINLGISPDYTFEVSEATIIADRFFIHFVDVPNNPYKNITSLTDNNIASSFKIYATDGVIKISSMQQQSGRVAVLDMSGRTVATGRIEAGASSQIDVHNTKGVYIVSIHTDKGIISNTKIVVN